MGTEDRDKERIAVGRRIRDIRKRKKMTQAQVAGAICKDRSTLGKYEKGKLYIRLWHLRPLAERMDCEPAALIDDLSEKQERLLRLGKALDNHHLDLLLDQAKLYYDRLHHSDAAE